MEWRGGLHKRPPLRWWLAISAIVHVPLTPFAGLLGLALLLLPQTDENQKDLPEVTEIPIDLLLEFDEPLEPAPAVSVPPQAPDPGTPPDAQSDTRDAQAPKQVPKTDPKADAGAAASPEASDPGMTERRPLAVAGARGVVDPNANIRLLIETRRLRDHALGARIGTLLGSVYQWRDFFGPTGIDPVKDIDAIFITGPQLRDSRAVVALIQHRLEPARLRSAINLLVQRDQNGQWLDGKVPTARARADRADRFFVISGPNLLVVTPEGALKSAQRLGPRTRLPRIPPPEIVTATVQTPWRALIGTGLSIPRSLAWMEARVLTTTEGGAIVRILAEDENPEAAKTSAAQLGRAVEEGLDLLANASNLFAFLFGSRPQKLADRVHFQAEGKRVVGELVFNESQVLRILDLARRLVVPPRSRPAPSAAGTADSGSSGPNLPRAPSAPSP